MAIHIHNLYTNLQWVIPREFIHAPKLWR